MALKQISVTTKKGEWLNHKAEAAFNEIKFFGEVLSKTSKELTVHGSQFVTQVWESYFDATRQKVILVMELADRSLLSEMRRYRTFTDDEVRNCMRGVLQALQWLHHCGVNHNDVKPANVLLFKPSFAQRFMWRIKLTDFGSATSGDRTTMSMLTTYPYAAPEILRSADLLEVADHGTMPMPYSHKSDVWSAGVVMAELLSEDAGQMAVTAPDDPQLSVTQATLIGVRMFLDHLAEQIAGGIQLDSCEASGSSTGLELVSTLAHFVANERTQAADALQHEWFQAHHATMMTARTPCHSDRSRHIHGISPAEWDSIGLALGRSYCLLSGIRGGSIHKETSHPTGLQVHNPGFVMLVATSALGATHVSISASTISASSVARGTSGSNATSATGAIIFEFMDQ